MEDASSTTLPQRSKRIAIEPIIDTSPKQRKTDEESPKHVDMEMLNKLLSGIKVPNDDPPNTPQFHPTTPPDDLPEFNMLTYSPSIQRKQFLQERTGQQNLIEFEIGRLKTQVQNMIDDLHANITLSLSEQYSIHDRSGDMAIAHVQLCDTALDRIRQNVNSFMTITVGYNLLSLPDFLVMYIDSLLQTGIDQRNFKNVCSRTRKLVNASRSSTFSEATISMITNDETQSFGSTERPLILLHLFDIPRMFTSRTCRYASKDIVHSVNYQNLYVPVDGTVDEHIKLDLSVQFVQQPNEQTNAQYNRFIRIAISKLCNIFMPMCMHLYVVGYPLQSLILDPHDAACFKLKSFPIDENMCLNDEKILLEPYTMNDSAARALMMNIGCITFGLSIEMHFQSQAQAQENETGNDADEDGLV
ncbi:MAG: hypothetical protein PHN45_00260 [Methylococcales bacterium]|nr:hypothetical protein [Methylococcales bacterium]